MNEATQIPSMIEKQQQQTDTMQSHGGALTGSMLDWSVGPMLKAQADLLAGAETTLGDWLHRRHEAIADMQQLITRAHTGLGDPGDVLRTQQELMSRSFRRFAADAEAGHSVVQHLMSRAATWFPQDGWAAFARDGETPAATRRSGRPF